MVTLVYFVILVFIVLKETFPRINGQEYGKFTKITWPLSKSITYVHSNKCKYLWSNVLIFSFLKIFWWIFISVFHYYTVILVRVISPYPTWLWRQSSLYFSFLKKISWWLNLRVVNFFLSITHFTHLICFSKV